MACAIGRDALVVVADAAGALVGLSGADGRVLWRTTDAGGEKLLEPSGIAALPDGSILLADRRRRRIDHFSAGGVWIDRFGGEVALQSPGHIAVGTVGAPPVVRVAVVDDASGEIALCSEQGTEVRRISSEQLVKKDGSRCAPCGVAFCSEGMLAVTADDQNQVFVLDVAGDSEKSLVAKSWGGRGPFPGLFNRPLGIESDGKWLFIADQFNHRVSRQDESGQGQLAYGQHAVRPREGEGAVHYPTDIAVRSGLAVVCEPFERRVQAFAPGVAAEPIDIRLVLPKLEGVQSHFGAAAARDGERFFMHDPESSSIVVFDLSKGQPLHVSNLGSAGAKPHEFGSIDAMLALADGTRLLVADGGNRRLALWELTPPPKEIIFEPFMGRLVKTRSYDRLGLPLGSTIVGLARGGTGEVFALSGDGPMIATLDASLRTAAAAPIAAPDTTARACAIAVGSSGVVGVLFDRPAQLCLFNQVEGKWTTAGTIALPDVVSAQGLVAMNNNEWLVVDAWGDGVQLVASDGRSRRFGSRGVADGQFWLPGAAAMSSGGDIYVVDSGNHRAQKFSHDGEWQLTFSLGRAYSKARTTDEVLKIRKKPPALPAPTSAPAAAPAPTSAPAATPAPAGTKP